jgi:hypothetical protein
MTETHDTGSIRERLLYAANYDAPFHLVDLLREAAAALSPLCPACECMVGRKPLELCERHRRQFDDTLAGYREAHRDKALIDAAALDASTHRCSGCGHQWKSVPGAELCGDCWRVAQPQVQFTTAGLTPDYLSYAISQLQAAKRKEEDAPASAASHERMALLALQLERVPTGAEHDASWREGSVPLAASPSDPALVSTLTALVTQWSEEADEDIQHAERFDSVGLPRLADAHRTRAKSTRRRMRELEALLVGVPEPPKKEEEDLTRRGSLTPIESPQPAPTDEADTSPIPLNDWQERAIKQWAADDRLWTTQETVEFNLRMFARTILATATFKIFDDEPVSDPARILTTEGSQTLGSATRTSSSSALAKVSPTE